MYECVLITDVAIQCIVTHCTRLEHLDVRDCPYITDSALIELCYSCHRLTHIAASHIESITTLTLLREMAPLYEKMHLKFESHDDTIITTSFERRRRTVTVSCSHETMTCLTASLDNSVVLTLNGFKK